VWIALIAAILFVVIAKYTIKNNHNVNASIAEAFRVCEQEQTSVCVLELYVLTS
jgi:hypothetical protein